MPGGSAVASGNELIDQLIYITVVPPAVITTATSTVGAVTVPGLVIGDLISWNQIGNTTGSVLLTVANMYVSAANTLSVTWTTEGATVNNATAQAFLLEVVRPTIVPYTALPNGIY
jgi:hypothetical protein